MPTLPGAVVADAEGRTVAVHSRAILECLEKMYDMKGLAAEIAAKGVELLAGSPRPPAAAGKPGA